MCNSPLKTGPKLVISADDGLSIAPALQEFSEAFSSPLEHLEDVSAIKVLFRGKRVSLIFDNGSEDDVLCRSGSWGPTDRPFVVRYTDHVLTVAERQAFEQLMEEVHRITVGLDGKTLPVLTTASSSGSLQTVSFSTARPDDLCCSH